MEGSFGSQVFDPLQGTQRFEESRAYPIRQVLH
jgi:hypothetical protein